LASSRPELLALHRGGFLHDIGKVAVPDSILYKNGRLTEDEWSVMKLHPVKGEEICRGMKSLKPVLPIIRSHHERWDGSGYPDGLKGEQIPLAARILQVADIYDALTTARPHGSLSSERHFSSSTRVDRGWRDPTSSRSSAGSTASLKHAIPPSCTHHSLSS
jgi:putative two-component system response regulator